MRKIYKEKILSRYEVVIAMSVPEALNTLGLTKKDLGDKDKIKKTYREKAMINHPDRGGSEEKMKLVNDAYDVLQDAPAETGKTAPKKEKPKEEPVKKTHRQQREEEAAKPKLSAETLRWLDNQKRIGNTAINTKVRADLEPYKMKQPMTLYRGLFSDDEEEYGDMPYFDKATPYSFKTTRMPESWTTDIKIARDYAKQGEGGYYVEYEAKPEDSIVDFSLLPADVKKKMINMHENEIVLFFNGKTIKVIARSH